MESSDEESYSLASIRENETLGEARKRRALETSCDTSVAVGGGHGGKVRRRQPGSVSRTKRSSAAHRGKTVSRTEEGKRFARPKAMKVDVKGKIKSRSQHKSENRRSIVTGVLGLPIDWNEEDCDYEDSEDETYEPSSPHEVSRSTTRTRNSSSKTRAGSRKRGYKADQGGLEIMNFLKNLSTEVVLNGIVRPCLCAASKCALQRTCKDMRQVVDMPEAWQSLDLRADVIGRRTLKSGRQSILSNQPLFFLARSVIVQSRFSCLTAVDLRGLNLGAMGSTPDLLVTLFKACRNLTTLNVWNTFVEHETLPQPDSAVEKVIAEYLPGVEHLALEMDASNKGLKLLLEGCTRLKSLHIGSRSNRRGDSVSMYPNDLGMKAFTTVGAPCLETLSLVDKINIGAAGLRRILCTSSCPWLTSLVLIRCTRVNDGCLKAIAPDIGRITSFTLDQCPIKPPTVRLLVERCPQLNRLVVCTKNGVLEKPQEGRLLLDMILARRSSELKLKLADVYFQRVLPIDPPSEGLEDTHAPSWLKEDAVLHRAVLDSASPRITIGPTETPDDRVSAFMAF